MSNPLLSHFPSKLVPRDCQVELLEALWQTLATTKKVIIASPTGSGKSLLALTIMKYMESLGMRGLYCTPLNTLVDQFKEYELIVDGIATLKGRKHYPCVAGRPTAEQGYCRDDECPPQVTKDDLLDNGGVRYCQRCKVINRCPCTRCVYRQAFKRFVMAPIGNTNFTMAMLGINNKPEIIIIDEIDSIESFVRMHHTYRFRAPLHSMYELEEHIRVLLTRLKTLSDQRVKVIETNKDKDKLTAIDSEHRLIKKDIDKASLILDDFEKHKEPWNITVVSGNGYTNSTFEPITTDRFVDEVTEGLITIMMSATPPRREGYAIVESGSPFPKEIRPWLFKPLGRMSLKYRAKNIPRIAEFIKTLKFKTVVHCVSYNFARELYNYMQGTSTLLQTESSRNEVIKEFKQHYDILLSINLSTGTDFPEPEICNNVIACVPWTNPTETLTKSKDKLIGTSWHHEKVARDIMQSYGRIFRNNSSNPLKVAYIVDSTFNDPNLGQLSFWYQRHKNLFYKWFTEAEVKTVPSLAQKTHSIVKESLK